LVVPFAYDQFDNGLRAKRFGVADVLVAKRLSVRRMQRKLARLLASPEVSRACDAVAKKMQQGPEMPWLLDRVESALGIAPENGEAGSDRPT
jgi:rhamnosyltransferase subunit B